MVVIYDFVRSMHCLYFEYIGVPARIDAFAILSLLGINEIDHVQYLSIFAILYFYKNYIIDSASLC